MLLQAFRARGVRPSTAWYLNDDANIAYSREAPHAGHLSQPVLCLGGDGDAICSIIGNRQGDRCAPRADLIVTNVPSGHWLPLERNAEHIEAIRTWLRSKNL